MKNYRLTYYGLSGFDYTGFDDRKEAIDYATDQCKKGLMTPVDLMEYNSTKDEYKVIGTFKVEKA